MAVAIKSKNLKAKTVKKENAYEVYVTPDLSWVWYVLKHWASEEKEASDPYARVFCHVFSPMTGSFGDMGDVYLAEIPKNDARAMLAKLDESLAGDVNPSIRAPLEKRAARLREIVAGNY